MQVTKNRAIVKFVRQLVAWPNRRAWLLPFSNFLMRRLAHIAMRKAGAMPASSLPDLHDQWRRSLPAMGLQRLIKIENDTVYAEIHSECALRGSGDVAACHRMMEYDREVMRVVGGEFVVLESQATPGRSFCTVAMRRRGASMNDLTPAHVKAGQVLALKPIDLRRTGTATIPVNAPSETNSKDRCQHSPDSFDGPYSL